MQMRLRRTQERSDTPFLWGHTTWPLLLCQERDEFIISYETGYIVQIPTYFTRVKNCIFYVFL